MVLDRRVKEYKRIGSSPSPSTEESVTKYKEKKPCEMCGSNENDDLIMTCFNCRVAREHVYCAMGLYETLPDRWICDECCAKIRVLFIKHGFAKGPRNTANSRRLNRAYNQVSVASSTSRVDGQNTAGSKHSGNEDSASNQQPETQISPLIQNLQSKCFSQRDV